MAKKKGFSNKLRVLKRTTKTKQKCLWGFFFIYRALISQFHLLTPTHKNQRVQGKKNRKKYTYKKMPHECHQASLTHTEQYF